MFRIFIAALTCIVTLYATAQDSSLKSFLIKNKADVSSSTIKNPLFDAAFYANQYFLFGENHGSSKPQQMDLALLKNLNQVAGVKYYIAEVDDTKAWMLNNYLATGDTTWLNKVFYSWKRDTAQWANQEYYGKFKDMYQFQKNLSSSKKIKVIGIDVPQDYNLIKEHVASLLDGKSVKSYQPLIDSLTLLLRDSVSKATLISFSKRMLPVITANESDFKSGLGNSFPLFKHLISTFTLLSAGMVRDSIMYRNLVSQIQLYHLEKEKMYGFLGFFHCLQTGYNHNMPFAALLKKHLILEGKIASIQMYGIDSKTMLPLVKQVQQMMPQSFIDQLLSATPSFPKNAKYIPYDLSNDNQMMQVSGISVLKDLSTPNTITLFRVAGMQSPFNKTKTLAEVTGFQTLALDNAADVTTNAFQYILLFRNSNAAIPIL